MAWEPSVRESPLSNRPIFAAKLYAFHISCMSQRRHLSLWPVFPNFTCFRAFCNSVHRKVNDKAECLARPFHIRPLLSTFTVSNMRGRQEKIFNLPSEILWIMALLVAIEGFSQFVTPETYLNILRHFAFVPGRFTFSFDPSRVTDAYNAIPEDAEFRAQAALFFLGDGKPQWWTPLTYAFLHGGWLHVGFNCLWFAAFGSAVARRFGTRRFLVFCVAAALAGAAAHYVTHIADLQPVVGASATVSGVMAAAVRFVFQPGAPLDESLGFTEHVHADHAYRQPALPLRDILSNRSAISFLGFWFLANFLFGTIPMPLGGADATVAWQAHIGGFLVGLLAFRWFDPPAPSLADPFAETPAG